MTRPAEIRYKGKKFRIGDFGKRLAELPRNLRRPVLLAFSEYMLKKFRLYPRYKYKSRAAAYPEVNGFFSDKQRRFVMAGIAAGRITPGSPSRTQVLKKAWKIQGQDAADIRSISLVNDAPAAVYAYHPLYQARQLDLVGWRDVDEMTEDNTEGALEATEKWIAKNFGEVLDKTLK